MVRGRDEGRKSGKAVLSEGCWAFPPHDEVSYMRKTSLASLAVFLWGATDVQLVVCAMGVFSPAHRTDRVDLEADIVI